MPSVNEIQNQVKDTVKKSQDTVVTTVKGWTETVNNAIPEINLPFADQIPNYVPQAKSAVNSAFDIAEQVVSRQRELVNTVLDAVDTRITSAQANAKAGASKSTSTSKENGSKSESKDDAETA